MAGQQQQIADTIFNMKRRMLRKDDCKSTQSVNARATPNPLLTASDSDGDNGSLDARKYNLKRKVHYNPSSKAELAVRVPPYKRVGPIYFN